MLEARFPKFERVVKSNSHKKQGQILWVDKSYLFVEGYSIMGRGQNNVKAMSHNLWMTLNVSFGLQAVDFTTLQPTFFFLPIQSGDGNFLIRGVS